jgi:hypothetical protein
LEIEKCGENHTVPIHQVRLDGVPQARPVEELEHLLVEGDHAGRLQEEGEDLDRRSVKLADVK